MAKGRVVSVLYITNKHFRSDLTHSSTKSIDGRGGIGPALHYVPIASPMFEASATLNRHARFLRDIAVFFIVSAVSFRFRQTVSTCYSAADIATVRCSGVFRSEREEF
ncbi:hypothetical protein KIN20_020364 [Parelaphostrongylus tenuis]|uniref:Uncharacterized protein n=1 Tax=Parelaphostrongylus tenuis TaxID=148309 RepID=A0AAD5N5U6_PARTN|nr:hypothetical protein KIN20_020364 [Parelaphostrongylus tenuis]